MAVEEDLVPLVRRFQGGDVQSFEALVERFAAPLARFVGHMVPEKGLAEDLLQSLWLKAWTHRQALQDPAKIKAWLYMIAHREALMHLRGSQKIESLEEADEPSTSGSSPEQALVREEDVGKVKASFHALPPLYKSVIWLAVVEELPHAQIAKVLGIPEGTCRSRLHNALNRLKKSVNDPREDAS